MKIRHCIFLTTIALSPVFADQLALSKQQVQCNASQHIQEKVCKAGYPVQDGQMPAVYNAPAGIDTNGWDAYFNIALLYWQARQDGMSLATPNSGGTALGHLNDTVIYQNFSYTPGFKIEAGFMSDKWDNWGALVEYTRIHGSYLGSGHADEGFIFMNPWMGLEGNTRAINFNSKWTNDLDVIDFGLLRTYYVGKRLSFTTYFGGRGGWIDQKLDFTINVWNLAAGLTNPILATTTSDSWFVGPRIGLKTNWIIGQGFHLIGNTSGSICYQKYKTSLNSDESNSIAQPGSHLSLNVCQLRPYVDLQGGFGWGTYAWKGKVHFDFQATYDFMAWFGQNMMRQLANITSLSVEEDAGSLYFQGLTLQGQITF